MGCWGKHKLGLATQVGVALLCSVPASAQDYDVANVFSEVRLGVALSSLELLPYPYGYLPELGSFNLANTDSIQANLYFAVPDLNLFGWATKLRPEIGGVINLRGRESLAHIGVNWQLPLGDVLYVEAEVGYAIHNGALSGATYPLRNLGCRTLIHWSYGVGANLTDTLSLTANLQHISNVFAGCTPNDGINNFGVSLGYKF